MTEVEAFQILGQFPHCDGAVLHAPSQCEYCDRHPIWQAYRIVMKINFTGERKPGFSPCPSEKRRTFDAINKWPGNRATNVPYEDPPPDPPSPFESLKED